MIDFPKKLNFGKTHDILITLFYVSPFLLSQKRFALLPKKPNTKSRVKKDARTFSKNSTTQENIKISKLK